MYASVHERLPSLVLFVVHTVFAVRSLETFNWRLTQYSHNINQFAVDLVADPHQRYI